MCVYIIQSKECMMPWVQGSSEVQFFLWLSYMTCVVLCCVVFLHIHADCIVEHTCMLSMMVIMKEPGREVGGREGCGWLDTKQ